MPPGDYTLWPGTPASAQPLQKKITVPAKGTAQVDFVVRVSEGRRSAHEIEENPHFGPERSARRSISADPGTPEALNGEWTETLRDITLTADPGRSHHRSAIFLLYRVVVPGPAYDVIDVEHGGTIEGTVSLQGVVPEPKGFNLITFPDPPYCGRISNGQGWRLLHDFVVGPHGGLKDAIVLFEGSRGRKTL